MILRVIHSLFGIILFGNGAYMLAAPEHWFHHGPAGVPNTGPFNMHFVRDVGVVFVLVGAALLWAAWKPVHARAVHWMAMWFLVGHAALHVFDILAENLPHAHWGYDAAGVFIPGILFAVLLIPPVWRKVAPAERGP